jgi:hypothetical protein
MWEIFLLVFHKLETRKLINLRLNLAILKPSQSIIIVLWENP